MPILKKPLAQGRTADVYVWDDAHVLKLFHTWFEPGNIQYEQAVARAVHTSGVKAPAVGDIVHVEGRNGLIYERIAGESMLDLIQRKPWKILTFARRLARLHAQMHDCRFQADVPTQSLKIQNKLQHADALPASTRTALLEALTHLPEGDRVCHGDFHPANVLVNGDEETVIDWIDATRGNPLADVARTSILALGAAESIQVPNPLMKALTKILHSAYLRHYFTLRPGGEEQYRRWLPIVAGARLSENIPELEGWLVRRASSIENHEN
jgi:uncharacterized protein (TIGR02172 family)